jgi:RNA polymerase sigma factor for flagellar operon FliA
MSPSSSELDGLSSHELNTYLNLVKAICGQIHRKLPRSVDYDDLYQNGVIGLMDAVKKYDHSKGVPFTPYARFRIRGAILDGFRKTDSVSRRDRRKVKQGDGTMVPIFVSTSEPGVAGGSVELRIEDTLAASPDHSPYQRFQSGEAARLLQSAMSNVPDRHRKILYMLFHDDIRASEVAKHFHVNESRVSQIRAAALKKMSAQLESRGLKFRDLLEAC